MNRLRQDAPVIQGINSIFRQNTPIILRMIYFINNFQNKLYCIYIEQTTKFLVARRI